MTSSIPNLKNPKIMSRFSIYETAWIDLVFENRNQAYGAYQMRRDSVKSSLTALFAGLLFVFTLGLIVKIVNNLNSTSEPITQITQWSEPLDVTKVYIEEKDKPIARTLPQQSSAATILKDQLINPIIVQANDANENIATNVENKFSGDVISEGIGSAAPKSATSETGIATNPSTEIDYGNTVLNATTLDKSPEFPGGIKNFYNYIGNNFQKPELEETNTFKIFVSFVIEKDGSMTDIKVLKDPGYGLGKEAIRVLQSLKTKWSPGMIGSKPVRTAYNLPITVLLN